MLFFLQKNYNIPKIFFFEKPFLQKIVLLLHTIVIQKTYYLILYSH